jgi:ribosomal protein L7Ae-like RNA K-turn-binding protein
MGENGVAGGRPPLLGLIGLGYRGRRVVVGVDAVRRELQARKCWCVVVAEDASPRAREKVVRLASARGVPIVSGPRAAAIGAQLGKPPVMVIGVRDRALADGMVPRTPVRS